MIKVTLTVLGVMARLICAFLIIVVAIFIAADMAAMLDKRAVFVGMVFAGIFLTVDAVFRLVGPPR